MTGSRDPKYKLLFSMFVMAIIVFSVTAVPTVNADPIKLNEQKKDQLHSTIHKLLSSPQYKKLQLLRDKYVPKDIQEKHQQEMIESIKQAFGDLPLTPPDWDLFLDVVYFAVWWVDLTMTLFGHNLLGYITGMILATIMTFPILILFDLEWSWFAVAEVTGNLIPVSIPLEEIIQQFGLLGALVVLILFGPYCALVVIISIIITGVICIPGILFVVGAFITELDSMISGGWSPGSE